MIANSKQAMKAAWAVCDDRPARSGRWHGSRPARRLLVLLRNLLPFVVSFRFAFGYSDHNFNCGLRLSVGGSVSQPGR